MAEEKVRLLEKVVEHLREELAALVKAQSDSEAAATDPDSKAEGKYDTRSLEMSYLAAGQARQIEVLRGSLQQLQRFEPVAFEITDAVDLGALVEIDREGDWEWFFLLPVGGGVEIRSGEETVTTLSPESPLFAQLQGKRIGEEFGEGARVSEVG